MKTANPWARGGIVGLVLVAPATGEPAERVTRFDSSPVMLMQMELPAVDPIPVPDLAVDPFPSRTYGNLEDVACIVELENRGIAYERVGHGVLFRHADTPDWLASARREILDCRLVLALDDLAGVVAARGVTTVLHYGVYRGDLPLPTRGPALHHVAALAIDVAAFVLEDGTRLDMQRDWRGHVGQPACDDEGFAHASEESRELRGIVCEAAEEKLFHQVLTPNHDARHRDHVHLEVMRGTEWRMVE